MANAYLTGWIVDVRKRVRFVPADASVISSRNPDVLVINQNGYFYVPNLDSGKIYEFTARNGTSIRCLRFIPKRGHNELEIALPTKPARIEKPKRPRSKPQLRLSAKQVRSSKIFTRKTK